MCLNHGQVCNEILAIAAWHADIKKQQCNIFQHGFEPKDQNRLKWIPTKFPEWQQRKSFCPHFNLFRYDFRHLQHQKLCCCINVCKLFMALWTVVRSYICSYSCWANRAGPIFNRSQFLRQLLHSGIASDTHKIWLKKVKMKTHHSVVSYNFCFYLFKFLLRRELYFL